MKNLFIILIISVFIMGNTPQAQNISDENNPFFREWNTPFGVPPFSEINIEHYLPAFEEGIEQQEEEIEIIANNKSAPTFENTVAAMDYAGKQLNKVSYVFYNLLAANTNEEMQKLAQEISPKLSKASDDILLNKKLFERVKSVYDNRDKFDLDKEELKLLEDTYKEFARNGAELNEEKKEKLRKINEELSLLTLKFGENILKETNRFDLVIDNEEDLAGLPEDVINGAKEAADDRDYKGKWVFTIQKPSMIPFLQYSEKRNLREKIYTAYINQGNHNNDLDNKENVQKIIKLRIERANLLGYKTHADYVLEERMAKNSENVFELLNKVWEPAIKVAKKEVEEMQAIIDKEGNDFKLQPWDWWYYAAKLKKQKYNLNEEELRPYFQLENVRKGAYRTAEKLYGIKIVKKDDIPVYHKDVEAFEVLDKDGSHIGILFTDYYPRESKRGGAWMNAYRKQFVEDGKEVTPVVCNVGNFSKPTGDKPSLISFDEALTLFHEFGHALHGLLSDVTYPSISGTSVPRDFVELPSQVMENWARHPDVIKTYAIHYKTGEPIPDELIEKINNAKYFNQGFETVEYLAASFLDMYWHTLENADDVNVLSFEDKVLDKIGLIPEIESRYRTIYFRHIFSSGYDAGYYSYIWAEVLDADAFQAFVETDLFDNVTAEKFRNNILSKGGTEDPMDMYKKFRGKEPEIEPLLERRGLN